MKYDWSCSYWESLEDLVILVRCIPGVRLLSRWFSLSVGLSSHVWFSRLFLLPVLPYLGNVIEEFFSKVVWGFSKWWRKTLIDNGLVYVPGEGSKGQKLIKIFVLFGISMIEFLASFFLGGGVGLSWQLVWVILFSFCEVWKLFWGMPLRSCFCSCENIMGKQNSKYYQFVKKFHSIETQSAWKTSK